MKQQKAFIPVDFSQYKESYSVELENKFTSGQYMSTEEVRQLMYGALVTDSIVDGEIFDLYYWYDMEEKLKKEMSYTKEKDPEKIRLIRSIPGIQLSLINALLSSGDGLTPESAITVISVPQEYEIAEQLGVPREYCTRQCLVQLDGKQYDCLEFKPNPRGIEQLYFDVTMIMKFRRVARKL